MTFLKASQDYQVEDGSWMTPLRRRGDALWRRQALPTRKTEDWKYTSLAALGRRDFFAATPQLSASLGTIPYIESLNANRLVFINGVFSAEKSTFTAFEGLQVTAFSEADDKQKQIIESRLDSVVDIEKHRFAALNSKCLVEGALVQIGENCKVEEPIYILNYVDSGEHEAFVNSRCLIIAEADSSVRVVEHYQSTEGKREHFSNSMCEMIVGERANLEHYHLLLETEQAHHIGGVHAEVASEGRMESFFLALGTVMTRVDVSVTYTGENGYAKINGVYLPKNKQHVDFHTCIEHAVPHCDTDEVFRGIIADSARAVFNGRIHIHKDAQKTEAYLSNKNLLTTNDAEVDTKPELEIYADDVRCAHGATVARLDPESVHYFKARGVAEEKALVMLSFGFINELLMELKLDAVTEFCRPLIANRFTRDA